MAAFRQWRDWVEGFVALGARCPEEPLLLEAGGDTASPPPVRAGTAPRVLLCSPHPDDEALVGALPLRLRREAGAEVVNLAMTLGSDPARREARLAELRQSCASLDFALEMPGRGGRPFAGLDPTSRGRDPARWQEMVSRLAARFHEHSPDLVLFPHDDDLHPTHVAVHFLVLAALADYTRQSGKEVLTVESEYWRPLRDPNCLVGVGAGDVARLLMALAAHQGEVRRNPYHLRLPARFMDAMRRGSEILAGFGSPVPDWAFAELYRLGRMREGLREFARPRAVGPGADIAAALSAAPC